MTATAPRILHETATRLRVDLPAKVDAAALVDRLERLPGVRSARVNRVLHCAVVHHDGLPETRQSVLGAGFDERPIGATPTMVGQHGAERRRSGRAKGHAVTLTASLQPWARWAPAALALSVPVLPREWRAGAALGTVAARMLTQARPLQADPTAMLLDGASLGALAVGGQPLVVSTSVLLRLLSESLSERLVQQVDGLLDHLLPAEAAQYQVLCENGDARAWRWWPLRGMRAGDRVRLFPGDVVPVDGCVVEGAAVLLAAAAATAPRSVRPGAHVSSGERLREGTIELRAEADAASSRLQRLRAHVRHAAGARDPAGRLTPSFERLLSLPLTASALVFGLTGDSARAASMLQADPQQGLDLALPLAREAALLALARRGLIAVGLEAIERLASARTLVLQDTGVLASGRWVIEAVHTEPGGDAARVRQWLAALAETPAEVLDTASFPDLTVRQWVRHGAVLRVGEHELHLASPARLRRVWGLAMEPGPGGTSTQSARRGARVPSTPPGAGGPALRRSLAVVAQGRVVARIVLASAWRPEAADQLRNLFTQGFERLAIFEEGDGAELAGAANAGPEPRGESASWPSVEPSPEVVCDDPGARIDWLAEATRDGSPLVMVHTVLRDLVPPGSLSLTPVEADIGSHGVLLNDPLASLVAARGLARSVHLRLRLHQGTATAANAALMTAAALRWMPPIGTTLLHHGFALLLLLDSLRVEALGATASGAEEGAAAADQTTFGSQSA